MKNDNLGVYIHIPFCRGKCKYCNFYSITPCNMDLYVNKVCDEIKKWGHKLHEKVDTIYLGGGTPSILSCDEIGKILDVVNKNFSIGEIETTVEVNPADYSNIDFEKLKFFGVNRISLGAQSLCEKELKILGRRHSVTDILSACDAINSSHIDNISLDLILGIPYQTKQSIEKFVSFCKNNNVKHVSAYLLKIEEGTPFFVKKEFLNLPSDDESVELYLYFCKTAEKWGYSQYEISNFSVPGFESKHNLKYWNMDDYLGIGPSAHSLINGIRFYYKSDVEDFIKEPYILSEGNCEYEKEYVMLQLRLGEGLKNSDYKKIFKKDIPEIYFQKVKKYDKLNLVKCEGGNIKLTQEGFLLSNSIIADILE